MQLLVSAPAGPRVEAEVLSQVSAVARPEALELVSAPASLRVEGEVEVLSQVQLLVSAPARPRVEVKAEVLSHVSAEAMPGALVVAADAAPSDGPQP